jgi:hypothetical protein
LSLKPLKPKTLSARQGAHLHHEQLLAQRAAALAQHLVGGHGDDGRQREDERVDVPGAGRAFCRKRGAMDGAWERRGAAASGGAARRRCKSAGPAQGAASAPVLAVALLPQS